MPSNNYSQCISFEDIAQTPYILDLYRGLDPFLEGAHWWIISAEGNRSPLGDSEHCISCDNNHSKEKQQELFEHGFAALKDGPEITHNHIFPCCEGFLQGIAGCWYRNQFLGGIGICHVPPEWQDRLERIVRIVQGYLALLAGVLEDHDDLELVHNVWSQTIIKINLDDLLPSLMKEICTAIGLENGVILLVNEDSEFYPAYVYGYPSVLQKKRNLNVTRFEYVQHLQRKNSVTLSLPAKDPLHQWLRETLETLDNSLAAGVSECLGIPFFRNESLIGVFLTLCEPASSLRQTKQSLIQLLATSGAAALDNAITVQQMEKRRKALSTIHVIHRLISSSISTSELLPRIGQLTRQLLKASKCSIMLLDHTENRLMPTVAIDLEANEVGQRSLELGEEMPGWVAENLNPMLYHSSNESKPSWVSGGDTYPAESYLSVALFDHDVEGVITVAGKDGDFTPGDRDILLTFAEQVVLAIRNARMHEGERTIIVNVLKSIANLTDTHDPEQPGITVQTSLWAQRIARVQSLSGRDFQNIVYAALLHDIGMLGHYQQDISIDELRMQAPGLGRRLVQSLGLSAEVSAIVYHVNEAWNGQGYPDGLKGNEIPLGSRIIAVANAYANLLHRGKDPSKQNSEKAFQIIEKLSGRSYDPDIIQALHQAILNPPDLSLL